MAAASAADGFGTGSEVVNAVAGVGEYDGGDAGSAGIAGGGHAAVGVVGEGVRGGGIAGGEQLAGGVEGAGEGAGGGTLATEPFFFCAAIEIVVGVSGAAVVAVGEEGAVAFGVVLVEAEAGEGVGVFDQAVVGVVFVGGGVAAWDR